VQQKENGGSFTYVITDLEHAPTGQVSYKAFGNGVVTTYTYDPNELYRLKNILTIPAGEGEGVQGGMSLGEELQKLAYGVEKLPLAIAELDSDISSTSPEEPDEGAAPSEPAGADESQEANGIAEESLNASSTAEAVIQASSEPASNSIVMALDGKTVAERADLKAAAIVEANPTGDYENPAYGVRVEIQKIEKIDGGIQIFARAWKGDKQLGFGKDGSVEIERFRIFNPPILVDDPEGTIIREWIDDSGAVRQRKLREDPTAAIRADLAHTISIVGKDDANIVAGKVGRTTDTLHPAGGESSPVDGRVMINGQSSWDAAHDATSGEGQPTTVNNDAVQLYKNGSGLYQISRGIGPVPGGLPSFGLPSVGWSELPKLLRWRCQSRRGTRSARGPDAERHPDELGCLLVVLVRPDAAGGPQGPRSRRHLGNRAGHVRWRRRHAGQLPAIPARLWDAVGE
jgi:hypothetical protein